MSDVSHIAGNQLRSFVERIERLEEDKKAVLKQVVDQVEAMVGVE